MMVQSRERGSEAIEAAIGVPAFMMFVLLIVAAGRVAIAHQSVEAASAEAARAASIARSQGEAQASASSSASASLKNQDLQCLQKTVKVDTSGFTAAVGENAKVRASITCRVKLSDVALPGLPGSISITESISSPIDTYRER